MEEVKFQATFDDSQVLNAYDRIIQGALGVKSSVDDIQDASNATSKAIVNDSKDSEKAMAQAVRTANDYRKAIEIIDGEVDTLNRTIKQQRLELAKMQKQYAEIGDKSTEAAKLLKDEMSKLSATIRVNANEVSILKQESDDYKKSLNDLKGPLGELLDELGAGAFEAVGQQFGVNATQASKFSRGLGSLASRLSLAGGAAVAAGAALVAIVAAPLAVYFQNSGKAAEFFANTAAKVQGVARELRNRLFAIGESVVGLIDGTKEWGDVTAAAANLVAGGYSQAAQAAVALEKAQRDLNKQQVTFANNEQNNLNRVAELRRIASDTEGRTIAQRRAALIEASRLEQNLLIQQRNFAQQQADIEQQRAGLDNEGRVKDNEAFNAAQIQAAKVQGELAALRFQDEQAILALQREAAEATKRQREEMQRLLDAAQKFRDQLAALEREGMTGVAAIRAQGDAALEQLAKEEAALRKLYADRGVRFNLEAEFARAREILTQQTERKIVDFITAEQEKIREQYRQTAEESREAIQIQLDGIERRGQALIAAQGTELARLGAQRAVLQEQLNLAQRAFIDGLLPANAVTELRNRLSGVIDAYEDELEATQLGFLDRFKNKLLDSLGLTAEEAASVEGAVRNVIGNAFNALQDIQANRIADIDAQLKQIDQRINAATAAVEEARRQQEAGEANNLSILEANLKREQAARSAALQERARVEARAARLRLGIDSAQRASDIASAVTGLVKANASLGIVGLVAALGGIALIARIVAQGRAIARQASQAAQGFKDGTSFVTGPGTSRSDSIPARLSVGERVVDAKTNKQIGGRSLDNADLARYVKIGKAVESGSLHTVAASLAETVAKAAAAQAAQQVAAIERATLQAARENSDKLIAYWQTRPVERLTEAGKVIEWQEGGRVVRQIVTSAKGE